MGDSVGVVTKSAKSAEALLAFLEPRSKALCEAMGVPEHILECWYTEGNTVWLADYYWGDPAHDISMEFKHALLSFLALHHGRKKGQYPSISTPVPYPAPYLRCSIDNDNWPILGPDYPPAPKKLAWCRVNELGMRLSLRQYKLFQAWLPYEKGISEEEFDRRRAICGGLMAEGPPNWKPIEPLIEAAIKPLEAVMKDFKQQHDQEFL